MLLTKTPQAVVAAAGKAVLNGDAGVITTESLTQAAGATYTLTLACNEAQPGSVVLVQPGLGSSTQGQPVVTSIVPTVGKIVIVITNAHATLALNGTLQIGILVCN